jgi:signal transduction histidine kinase
VTRLAEWLRPPRLVLTIFLSIAALSGATLSWLAWLLLEQDRALDLQRQQVLLEERADLWVGAVRERLSVLVPSKSSTSPRDVLVVSLTDDDVRVIAGGPLLYSPVPARATTIEQGLFARGEELEFAERDLDGALRAYGSFTAHSSAQVRAAALSRVARIRRQAADMPGALDDYDRLARLDAITVDGLPAGLVALVGKASIFEKSGQPSALRDVADALAQGLSEGRWRLSRHEYEFYAALPAAWAGVQAPMNRDAAAKADAVEWLWQNGQRVEAPMAMALAGGPVYVAPAMIDGVMHASIVGPEGLQRMVADAFGTPGGWALTDAGGRVVLGEEPPARLVAQRRAGRAGLPWTLHVFPSGDVPLGVSPRRQLLLLVLGVVALVLLAGWYFIVRAISRELRVSRLQSDFVAAVSHEFRSPLTSISHIAELLATDRLPDAQRRQSYAILARDSDRLRRLIESLLDFGRFEAGARALRLDRANLSELVKATVVDFQAKVHPDGYTVELSGAENECLVRVDAAAVAVALWNLLDNAVKYSPDCKTVWVELQHAADHALIVVRDRGLGIPMHEQREIFERFVRGRNVEERKIKGTGLGLALARHILQAHGGDLRLKSESGHGSDFTMVLRTAGGDT